MTIPVKAIEQYFSVASFIMLIKVFPTFASVDESLLCDDSSESPLAVLSCGAICFVII